jgi:hypothetical protein
VTSDRATWGRIGIALIVSLWLHYLLLKDVSQWQLEPPEYGVSSGINPESSFADAMRATLVERSDHPTTKPESVATINPQPVVAPTRAERAGRGSDRSTGASSAPLPTVAPSVTTGSSSQGNQADPGHYYSPAALSMRAHPIEPPSADAFKSDYFGDESVRLRVFVDATGHVDHAEALPETRASPEFVARMIDTIKATRFVPGEINNLNVNSYFDVDLDVVPSKPILHEVHP